MCWANSDKGLNCESFEDSRRHYPDLRMTSAGKIFFDFFLLDLLDSIP